MEGGEHGEGSGSGLGGLGQPGNRSYGPVCRSPPGPGRVAAPPGLSNGCVSSSSSSPAGEEAEAGGGHGSHKKKHKKHKKKHKKKHHHEAVGPPPPPAPEPAAGLRKPQLKLKIKLGGQILGTKR